MASVGQNMSKSVHLHHRGKIVRPHTREADRVAIIEDGLVSVAGDGRVPLAQATDRVHDVVAEMFGFDEDSVPLTDNLITAVGRDSDGQLVALPQFEDAPSPQLRLLVGPGANFMVIEAPKGDVDPLRWAYDAAAAYDDRVRAHYDGGVKIR